MNTLELIQALQKKCNLTKEEANEFVKTFFSEMTNTMIHGDRIEIRGFCSFLIKEYKGYIGRNPKTGTKVLVPPKKFPLFKPGKELKERVDFTN